MDKITSNFMHIRNRTLVVSAGQSHPQWHNRSMQQKHGSIDKYCASIEQVA